jgi:hypothetical protein
LRGFAAGFFAAVRGAAALALRGAAFVDFAGFLAADFAGFLADLDLADLDLAAALAGFLATLALAFAGLRFEAVLRAGFLAMCNSRESG